MAIDHFGNGLHLSLDETNFTYIALNFFKTFLIAKSVDECHFSFERYHLSFYQFHVFDRNLFCCDLLLNLVLFVHQINLCLYMHNLFLPSHDRWYHVSRLFVDCFSDDVSQDIRVEILVVLY